MPIIPALGTMRQEDCQLEASLSYLGKTPPQEQSKNKSFREKVEKGLLSQEESSVGHARVEV